jgi:hypothetical protein
MAVYLRKRGPIKNKTKTPREDWFNEKPSVAHYKVFGCPAWVHVPKVKKDKLKTKAWKGIFIGYREDTVTTYKIWDLVKKVAHEARFVIFDEGHTGKSFEQLEAEYDENEGAEIYEDPLEQSESDDDGPIGNGGGVRDNTPSNTQNEVIPNVPNLLHNPERPAREEQLTPLLEEDPDDEDNNPDDQPQPMDDRAPDLSLLPRKTTKQKKAEVDARRLAKNQKAQEERLVRKQQEEERGDRRSARHKANLALQSISKDTNYIPKSYEDARTCPDKDKWNEAIQSELSSITERNTFSQPIKLQPNEQTIDAKFVFDLKMGENGEIL